MVSPNKHIPKIELYGIFQDPLKLVNEGDLNRNGTYEVVTYKLGTTANGDKTEAIIGSILEYLCTKIQRKVNHGKMFNISFEEVSCSFGKLSLFLQNNIKKV